MDKNSCDDMEQNENRQSYFGDMKKNFKQIMSLGDWAVKSNYLEGFASSGFDEDWEKPSGEVDQKNRVDLNDDGIAIMHIDGALGYRSNIWTAIFGLDTYNSITAAFDKLMSDESVKGIVLSIHSPGGLVSGVDDVAEKIFKARGSKPAGIVAHSAGSMCSSAYWIASACEKVYASSNAEVGSIGVLSRFRNDPEGKSVLTVRSNLSQNKTLDPNTPRGMLALEEELDAMASAFISKVAKFRGTDYDTVLEKYGQGKVFIGENAVKAGLVDAVASLDEVVEIMTKQQKEAEMAEKTNPAAQTAAPEIDMNAVKASAVAEERQRILGIQQAFEGLALDEDCQKFISEGKTVAEAESFCFKATKKLLGEARAQQNSAPATASAETTDPSAEATAQQQALIKAGIAANAAAANSIAAGANSAAADADKLIFDAFAAGAKAR